MTGNDLTYIDLFAGAGGLSEGFIRQGFTPIAHVEMDKYACFTLKTRLAYHYLKKQRKLPLYNQYLKGEITLDELYSHLPEELMESVINKPIGDETISGIFASIDHLQGNRKVDLVIGGPPCQAYSIIGRSRDPNKMKDDPRNYLFEYYTKFLRRYKPTMFVFENVEGLLSAANGQYFKQMRKSFHQAGYALHYKTLKAEDYGVLQLRRRVILVGWLREKDLNYPDIKTVQHNSQIKDLLSDLPAVEPADKERIKTYNTQTNEYLKKYNIRNGSPFVTQHITRPHCDRDIEIYKIAIKKWLENRERLNYNDLPEQLKTHKNRKSFLDRFKVVDPSGMSHTMVAHIQKDGHYYIYPDLNQVRSISIREAARIQSFPDDFYFEGGQSAAFRQIGNAVPPLMAEQIAKGMKKVLR